MLLLSDTADVGATDSTENCHGSSGDGREYFLSRDHNNLYENLQYKVKCVVVTKIQKYINSELSM